MAGHFRDFVGRALELNDLRRLFAQASRGESRIALIVGEAGIGKTRLVAELCKYVERTGGTVAIGHCLQFVDIPYLPFSDVFQSLFQVPLTVVQPARGEEGSGARKALEFASAMQRLRRSSSDRPLMLCIEDLHFADSASLELIEYAARHLASIRVFLVLTSRDPDREHRPDVATLLSTLVRCAATNVTLAPLPENDMRCLTRAFLADYPGVSYVTMERVEELAEGNPFFAEEMLRSVVQHRSGSPDIPMSARAVIGVRLQALDPRTRRVLGFAAVIGRRFSIEFVRRVSGLSHDEILTALREARVSGIIDELPSVRERFAYHHALIRMMVYDELLEMDRRELHARVGELLEDVPDRSSRIFELAYHWAEADAPSKALVYNEHAGDAAAGMGAYADALRYYDRAIGFQPVVSKHRADLCEKAARAAFIDNSRSDVMSLFERALREYSCLGDTEKMAEMLIFMCRQSWCDMDSPSGVKFASQALDLLAGGSNSRLYAHASVMLASYHAILGRPREAMRRLATVSVKERQQSPQIAAHFYDCRGLAHALLGEISNAIADFEAGLEAADRSGEAGLILRIYGKFAYYCLRHGKGAAGFDRFERAISTTRGLGSVGRTAYAILALASWKLCVGDLAGSRRLLECPEAQAADTPAVRITYPTVCAELGLALGDDDLLRHLDRSVVESAIRTGEAEWIESVVPPFVDVLVKNRKFSEAQELLRRTLSAVSGSPHLCGELLIRVAAHGDLGDVPAAYAILSAFTVTDDNQMRQAFLELFRAAEAGRRSIRNNREAASFGLQAAKRFERLGWPLHQAKALEYAGRVSDALSIYRRVGAVAHVDRLERKIATRNRRGRSGTALTEREREIAELASEGSTNRQIAALLGISEHTVVHHLQSVFNRLGIRSRADLEKTVLAR